MFRGDESLNPDINFGVLNNNTDAFNCNYYSREKFQLAVQHFMDNGLSIICFNIRSFTKNSDEFIGYLVNCGHPFDAIVFTETWTKHELQSLCHIPGYQAVHNSRPERKGGGVSIFIKQDVEFDVINDLNISNDDIEMLGLKLILDKSENKTLNLIGVYRPPSGNTDVFMSRMSNVLDNNRLTANDNCFNW